MRYFIFDCNGALIGNPKGYRTFRGASIQEKRLYPLCLDRLEALRDSVPYARLVSSIRQCAPNDIRAPRTYSNI